MLRMRIITQISRNGNILERTETSKGTYIYPIVLRDSDMII